TSAPLQVTTFPTPRSADLPHGRRPHGRAGRRGPADLQLGGAAGRGGPARARPPDAERGARRGAPGAGRQAPALPRLTPSVFGRDDTDFRNFVKIGRAHV